MSASAEDLYRHGRLFHDVEIAGLAQLSPVIPSFVIEEILCEHSRRGAIPYFESEDDLMAANRFGAWPLTVIVLSGCGGHNIVRDYQPNPAEPQAEFELALLDPMAGNETFEFTNYIWHDCKEKPIEETILKLDGDDQSRTQPPPTFKTRLPAGRQLKLSMWHQLQFSPKTIYCMDIKVYTFKAGKKYRYQMHNQTTPGSKHKGFGCLHELVEMDADGGNARQIYGSDPPKMSNCN